MLDSPAPHSVNRGSDEVHRRFPALETARQSRTHSSAGERSLHTGEVQGSIPCASTSKNPSRFFDFRLRLRKELAWLQPMDVIVFSPRLSVRGTRGKGCQEQSKANGKSRRTRRLRIRFRGVKRFLGLQKSFL